MVLMAWIGLRHEVGGDWFNYIRQLENADFYDLKWWGNDPGYRFAEWLAINLNTGIYGVNFFCAAIFSYGLVQFCRTTPRPWLSMSISVPYLIIVLGMGYTRQGVALGLIMLGMTYIERGNVFRFVLLAMMGALFHKSAVLLIPLVALAESKKRSFIIFWVIVSFAASYILLLQQHAEQLRSSYIDAQYESEGALVRLLMTLIPAALFLAYRSRFRISSAQSKFWFWTSIMALMLFGSFFVSPSSTAVDRVALYTLPLQLWVFSHLPDVFGRSPREQSALSLIIILYYGLVLYVWLAFATNAAAWLPYKWYPLQ